MVAPVVPSQFEVGKNKIVHSCSAAIEQATQVDGHPFTCPLSGPTQFAVDGPLYSASAGSVCEVLEGLAFVRAPEGCERRIAPGALCCRSGSPPIPAETGREYSNYSQVRIVADIGRSYGVGHSTTFRLLAQKRAEVT
jgi:hypothetical protein